MNITPMQMYWLTKLDNIIGFLSDYSLFQQYGLWYMEYAGWVRL